MRARRAHSRHRAVESEAGVEAEAGVESEAGTDKSDDMFKKHGRYARKYAGMRVGCVENTRDGDFRTCVNRCTNTCISSTKCDAKPWFPCRNASRACATAANPSPSFSQQKSVTRTSVLQRNRLPRNYFLLRNPMEQRQLQSQNRWSRCYDLTGP